jgi:hypothetical protein
MPSAGRFTQRSSPASLAGRSWSRADPAYRRCQSEAHEPLRGVLPVPQPPPALTGSLPEADYRRWDNSDPGVGDRFR